MAQADRRGSAAALALIRRGKRGDEDDEAPRSKLVADASGPRFLRAKKLRPAPPSAPQRAGFGLGPPAFNFDPSRRKKGS